MIEASTRSFWKTTIALCIGSLIIFANVYFTQPILPVLSEEFNLSPLLASMSVSLVILALGISLVFYGPISDSIGRRGIMIMSIALSTVLTFSIAFSTSYEWFLTLRVVQGISLAGLPALAVAYIGEEYSPRALTLAIGIYISGNTIGGMFGRLLSGTMTDWFGWRSAFLTMSVVSLVLFLLFIVLLKPSQHFQPKPFRWKEALHDYKGHLQNKYLWLAYLIGGLHFFIFVGHFNYVTYLLSGPPFHLSSSWIGALFLTYIAGTISSPVAGKLAERFHRTMCIKIGILIMMVGFLTTLIPHISTIIIGLLFNCFGFFFAHSIASSWVNEKAAYAKASASGLYLISYYIGGSLGPLYLEPFWAVGKWFGVVLGCLIVLGVTSLCAWKLSKLEDSSEINHPTN
ncbi:MFS transporter [Radiobacillus kanasensis]|uniref:MFS transporter n=1 Tax=Radiobacillus kanasensis TaxID=2844358 RepID=UPI001E5F33E7|nr:MFS transporter [Radiobacillus kanasensis]UFT98745.1 MFS transporter [Radiobacillus kanasensis]